MASYEILKEEGRAKRARFKTAHGTIETPVFMNVGTAAAIKGAVSSPELRELKCQVELCNTYHLHVRPGDDVVKEMGGVRKFMCTGRFSRTQAAFRSFLLRSSVRSEKRA